MLKRYHKSNFGISLVSLVITIIVILILAAIVIISGLSTPTKAKLAKFSSEISDFGTAVINDAINRDANHSVNSENRTKAQIYYEIATGIEKGMSQNIEVEERFLVSELGQLQPEGLKGTEYYEILDDKNITGWNKKTVFYSDEEGHYLTDKGEVFILPGYLEETENGDRWWINEKTYYTGDPILKSKRIIASDESDEIEILNSAQIDQLDIDQTLKTTLKAELATKTNVAQVVKGKADNGVAVIPNGFEYLTGTVETGLVIKDTYGNEFVWIPVDGKGTHLSVDDMIGYSEEEIYFSDGLTTTHYYGKGNTVSGVLAGVDSNGYREPDVCYTYDDKSSLPRDLAASFEAMAKSVIKYQGFYVGRYELGYDETTNKIVCKPDVLELTACKGAGKQSDEYGDYAGTDNSSTWYGLYRVCKGFSRGGAVSGMIWGCQWDAMIAFIGNHRTQMPEVRHLTGQYPDVDGTDGLDKYKNVYDTSSGLYDWSCLVNASVARAIYGGKFNSTAAANSLRTNLYSAYTNCANTDVGTRLQLYIK